MSTRQYKYPSGTDVIGTAEPNGQVRINRAFVNYLRGLEDVSRRVAENVPAGSSTDELLAALKAAESMKPDS